MNDDTVKGLTDVLRAATENINRNPIQVVTQPEPERSDYAPPTSADRIERAETIIANALMKACEEAAGAIESDMNKMLRMCEDFAARSNESAAAVRAFGQNEATRITRFMERLGKAQNLQDQIPGLFRKDSIAAEMDKDLEP